MSLFEANRPLLDAFRRGERAALAQVYSCYVGEVAALARRGFSLDGGRVVVPGLRDPAAQRDLIHETFLRAFAEKARLSYDGLSPFRPWITRIARNLMIDELRRQGRFVATPVSLDAEEVQPVSPEDELAWKRLREATLAYCATLDEALRTFVRLRFEEERSQADVAEALQVTRRKVRSLEEQVRAGLRVHLRKTCGSESRGPDQLLNRMGSEHGTLGLGIGSAARR